MFSKNTDTSLWEIPFNCQSIEICNIIDREKKPLALMIDMLTLIYSICDMRFCTCNRGFKWIVTCDTAYKGELHDI